MLQSYVRGYSSHVQSQRGLTLAEVIVALAITVLILTVAVGMIASWRTGVRTFPLAGSRGASDAQVQQMVAELRNIVAVSYISAGELVARINTAANYPNPPVVNGTATGAYSVAYFYGADAHTLYRNGSGAVVFNGPVGGWQAVADNLAGLSFIGYDANMNQTTAPSQIAAIGITVQYQGLPPEQEMLVLRGTSAYTTFYSHPLTIPSRPLTVPSSSGSEAASFGGGGRSGPSFTSSPPGPAGVATVSGPDSYNASYSFGAPTSDMVQSATISVTSGAYSVTSGAYTATTTGYGSSTLEALAAAVKAISDDDARNVQPYTQSKLKELDTVLQSIADRLSAATTEAVSSPNPSGDESNTTGSTSPNSGSDGSGGGPDSSGSSGGYGEDSGGGDGNNDRGGRGGE